MPYHDRAKARLEHEVTILRTEVVKLRAKQEQRRQAQREQAVLQARLEQQIHNLESELAAVRHNRKERECGGAEQSTKLNQHLKKLDGHVAKQEHYINFLEEQINLTRNKYQQRMTDVRQSADEVEEKLQQVRNEMRTIKERASEVDQLQKRLACLNAKLERRNNIIAHYEAQHADFMQVIADLQKQVERQAGGCAGKEFDSYFCKNSASDVNTEEDASSGMPPSVPDFPKPSAFNCLRTALKMKLETKAH